MRRILVLFWLLTLTQCEWQDQKKPSILIIGVEALSQSFISCGSQQKLEQKSGFQELCETSVRFTHAYTPSALSLPTLASILTARFPYEHGVWHNGAQFLSAKYETVAEVALQKEYRTAFFSGGPPIWRKSGLHQGFEVFDDNIAISPDHYYRPALETFQTTLQWLERDSKERSSFVAITVSDLQFPQWSTTTDQGGLREKSFDGQFEEVDESLFFLFKKLKELGRWDSTHIFVFGLNGQVSQNRPNELRGYNLYSENTQVALFIKPASRPRDLGLHWKEDKNISLVDIGATLYDLMGASIPRPAERLLQVISLKPIFNSKDLKIDESRLILIESGWSNWHNLGSSRFAVKKDNLLYLFDKKKQIYNTLTDRMETIPLPLNDYSIRNIVKEIDDFINYQGWLPWEPPSSHFIDKIRLASQIWGEESHEESIYEEFRQLMNKMPGDKELYNWWASVALNRKNWNELKKIADISLNSIWTFVAQSHLTEEPAWPKNKCIRLLRQSYKKFVRPPGKICDDTLFLDLLSWMKQIEGSPLESQYRDDFSRAYNIYIIDRDINLLNYTNGLTWDVSVKNLEGPSLTELILATPYYRNFDTTVKLRAQR